ncbi:MAG: sensor histidine kinase [Deltaproteobacteria bacterium]|nr:sensor histidine kinase [Deltaproteobacteria bacterium]
MAARTVLELGAELISSDAIAIYELVKNAIDAKSPSGVEVSFVILIGRSASLELLAEIENGTKALPQLKASISERFSNSYDSKSRAAAVGRINACTTVRQLQTEFQDICQECNYIQFSDTGHGMTSHDIADRFLLIGTPAKRRVVMDAEVRAGKGEPGVAAPYLGEKGVGRLSAMRLGSLLRLETATTADAHLNTLEIDWRRFDDPELLIQDIKVEPKSGPLKPFPDWSGTVIRIFGVQGNWSPKRIRESAAAEFSRLADPFSMRKKRFRVAIFYNGQRIEIPRMDEDLLSAAHARVRASYAFAGVGAVQLEVEMSYKGPVREEKKRIVLGPDELSSLTDTGGDLPRSALRDLGPFEFEAYWYNRQKLVAIDSIGDRAATRELQRRWAGIMMFRDGYRVSPYGDEQDDWLSLDRRALASPGYKLNKAQFIGRVNISRLNNPRLVDQTNREGLKDCSEKQVLVHLLRYVVQDLLKGHMDEVNRQQASEKLDVDLPGLEDRIENLEKRTKRAFRELRQKHSSVSLELRDIERLFDEMRSAFDMAVKTAALAKDEQERLLHLAGIGLMLEVLAHELARSTESALSTLSETQGVTLPADVSATLRTLRSELLTMNKRLRVLDVLSVPGRQRREHFDLVDVLRDSFAGRKPQFDRHKIRTTVTAGPASQFPVHGVKGMYVQIFENLTSNSVFWLGRRSNDEFGYRPQIRVAFDTNSREVAFEDNGPGIHIDLSEEVFRPFFSTKDQHRRQGLGLYIARECAVHNGATLVLSSRRTEHPDRLNTFTLTVPEA